MRILFVGTSLAARGTEQHLLEMARGMGVAGHSVELFVAEGGYLDSRARALGIDVSNGRFRNALAPRGWLNLWRAMRRFRPDWIVGAFGHEYFPVTIVGAALGCRVALFRHLNSRLGVVTRRCLPMFFERMIAVSQDMHDDLLQQGLPAGKLAILRNPIDTSRFRPSSAARAETRAVLAVSEDEVLVGFVGPFEERKGAPLLARVMNRVMASNLNLRCAWVGPKHQHGDLQRNIDPSTLSRHTFLDWTHRPEAIYPAFDALAVPSQWREPFGRVSVEAQACGVFVLASDVGGLPETMTEGISGRLLPARDEDAWYREICALAKRQRSQERIATVAAHAARFDTVGVVSDFERLLMPGAPEQR